MEKPELMMPKTDTGTDNLGISYQGPVLSGQLGLNQQLQRQAVSPPHPSTDIHCYQGRPIQPDPVYAAQRARLPHPSLADPVLRHHLNLPPLPDPYEERRLQAEYWAIERLKHLR